MSDKNLDVDLSLDARSALRTLEVLLKKQEGALKNSVDREAELKRHIEKLEQRVSKAEQDARDSEEATRNEKALRSDVDENVKALTTEVNNLTRRASEAERRATSFEQEGDTLRAKADRHDDLETACGKLLATLDRLPLTMDEAGIIPGAARPKIELYGTYDWQNVMDAKFALKQVLRKEK